jgi:hypothetical protein
LAFASKYVPSMKGTMQRFLVEIGAQERGVMMVTLVED